MNSKNIFLSYSRADREFVTKLESDLIKEGLNVWRDEQSIEGGRLWDRTIEEAIDNSDVILLIISPNSATSINVGNEVQYAIDEGKRLVPILLEKTTKIPLTWRRYQRIDFTLNYEMGFLQLINSVHKKEFLDVSLKKRKKSNYYKWLLVLSLVIITFGSYLGYQSFISNTQTETKTDVSIYDPILEEKYVALRDKIDRFLIEIETTDKPFASFLKEYKLIESDMQSIQIRLGALYTANTQNDENNELLLRLKYKREIDRLNQFYDNFIGLKELHEKNGSVSPEFINEVRSLYNEWSMEIQVRISDK